jgi:DNA-directed RNA polymerase specialized sigma24 family protein
MSSATSGRLRTRLEPAGFDLLLDALDPDRDRAGRHYSRLHQRLVKFFEWHCSHHPDEQADEVIDRLTRRLAEGNRIESLEAYAHGVARLLLREAHRAAAREEAARAQLRWAASQALRAAAARPRVDDGDRREQACFDHCLAALTPHSREIILGYYAGERRIKIEGRRDLAARLGADLNALRVRAHRIRARLEGCVSTCLGRGAAGDDGPAGGPSPGMEGA